MRISPEALQKLRLASDLRQQDLTSFVLGSAINEANQVILKERLVTLTEEEFTRLERIVEAEVPNESLVELMSASPRNSKL